MADTRSAISYVAPAAGSVGRPESDLTLEAPVIRRVDCLCRRAMLLRILDFT